MQTSRVSLGLAGRFAFHDMRAYAESMLHPRLLQLALRTAFFAGAVGLASSAVAVYFESQALHLAIAPAHGRADPLIAASLTRPSRAEQDFVSELPVTAPTDLQIRFSAKLAHEQDVTVVQMQSEPLKSDSLTLGQDRITLQLRGDYRGIKNVWMALLSKYPGLTLQRLTVRHHADAVAAPSPAATTSPLPSADGADDEASIEMIQYTQPPALQR